MIGLVITSAVILALCAYLIGVYNGLVCLRENIKVCWSNIDTLLKRRHEELPKLVETCRRYMQFEQGALDKVMRARASVYQALCADDVSGVGATEQQLRVALFRLFAAADQHLKLSADETFKQLRTHVAALEESIEQRRGLYNAQVHRNAIRVKVFPDVVIAQLFGFEQAQVLEFCAETPPQIGLGTLYNA